MLALAHFPRPALPAQRVVLVHGFTQTAHCWDPLANALAQDFEVSAVDLPGHGATNARHDGADLWDSARLLTEAGGDAFYVGYSLGGRVLLHALLQNDVRVRGAVVIGARAGFRKPAERQARKMADEILSDRLVALGDAGLGAFIDDWLEQPFNTELSPAARCRDLRLQSRAAGLAASLRRCGAGEQDDLWTRLPEIEAPVLLLRGEHDMETVVNETAEMKAAIGDNASTLVAAGVGHAGPFQDVDLYSRLITGFVLDHQDIRQTRSATQ